MLKFAFMTRNFIHCSSTVTLVILPDDKYIMQTESCDLNKYLNTNFTIQVPTSLTSSYSQIPVFGFSSNFNIQSTTLIQHPMVNLFL